MTRAERHAAGMERALKELERVAAHNPELADALGLIQRGEDGTITVGSLRRAEAALREKYAAAAERKKAEMEAEARAREDEAELARLKAELASPGSAASTPRRVNPPEPSRRGWASPANPFPADATISPVPTTPGAEASPSPMKQPAWNPTIKVESGPKSPGATPPKSPKKSPGPDKSPVPPRTVASYVERHALHARRAFELLAGSRGGTDADTTISFLRRFCGERDAPAAELASLGRSLRSSTFADNVTFSDLMDALGFSADVTSPAPGKVTSIAKAAADHYPYEIDQPKPPTFSPAKSDASSVRRSADLGHRVHFADEDLEGTQTEVEAPERLYPPPPEDPAKPSAPPSPAVSFKVVPMETPPSPEAPAAPSAPPADASLTQHAASAATTAYDAYDAEAAATAMDAAREAIATAGLAASLLPPAVGPVPPVQVPPAGAAADAAIKAERAILERAAAYQRAMSGSPMGSMDVPPGSATSTSSSAPKRNPRLDEWTAEVTRARREVERKLLQRESEREAKAALEDQWSAFLEKDTEPADEFLRQLAREHRTRAKEVERLKSEAAVTAERLSNELTEANRRDEAKRELLSKLHSKASEMAKADAEARETEARTKAVKESLPPVAKVVSMRFDDWRGGDASVAAAPALAELSAVITRDLDESVARVVRAVSGGGASSSDSQVGASFYVAPQPAFNAGPYTLVAPPVAPVAPRREEPEMTERQRVAFEQQMQLNAVLRRQQVALTQQLAMREAEEARSRVGNNPPSTNPPSTPPRHADAMKTVPAQWQSPGGAEPPPPGTTPPPPPVHSVPVAPVAHSPPAPVPAPPPAAARVPLQPQLWGPPPTTTAVPLPSFPAPGSVDLGGQPRWTGPAPPLWVPETRAPGFGEPRGDTKLTGSTGSRDYVSDAVENAYRSTLEQQRAVFGKR